MFADRPYIDQLLASPCGATEGNGSKTPRRDPNKVKTHSALAEWVSKGPNGPSRGAGAEPLLGESRGDEVPFGP